MIVAPVIKFEFNNIIMFIKYNLFYVLILLVY